MKKTDLRLAALVLAAGESKRFGEENKLLFEVSGKALLRIVVDALVELEWSELMVVLGHEAEAVEKILAGSGARCLRNPRYREGMGSTLGFGIRNLDTRAIDGVLVSLGDLPRLKNRHVTAVIEAFESCGGDRVVIPTFQGRRGHPVCFPLRMVGELSKLSGDRGARKLIDSEEPPPLLLPMSDDACIRDMDTKNA